MNKFSIVIVCRNESAVIARTLASLEGLTDDVVLYDNGSTDNTIEIASHFNVKIHRGTWEGFGRTRQKATLLAKYDWVLGLDADEAIDGELKESLHQLNPGNENMVYRVHRKNYMLDRALRYGGWGRDNKLRLFNRKWIQWDSHIVHEKLVLQPGTIISTIKGNLLHRTAKDPMEYQAKLIQYAFLAAERYSVEGRYAPKARILLAPAYAFFKSYILNLGFLDGRTGYVCARMSARYTFIKYARLRELLVKERKEEYKPTHSRARADASLNSA